MPVDDDDGRHRVNALADGVADLCLLLGRGAIFLCQVLGDVLATSGHLRVEFKRLNVELGPYIAGQIYQRPLKGRQADGTPGQEMSETKSILSKEVMALARKNGDKCSIVRQAQVPCYGWA